MGLLKHIRSRSRLKSQQELRDYPKPPGRDYAGILPRRILVKIFEHVAPHCTDESYEVSEKSMVGSGCMLCDLRDLSSCAKVNRRWFDIAQYLLYRSVRIDAVHFCPLEEVFVERRKRKHIDPASVPYTRLRLLQRTVWENSSLANGVLYLKLPYMTRESCKADLARTISALPNLRYVDLPDGFYSADPSAQILRDELQTACLDIRKMTYTAGAEQAFEALGHSQHWLSMEVMELSRLDVEPQILRAVLSVFPALHELKLTDLPRIDDSVFQRASGLQDFPPLHKLHIQHTPGITAKGLANYVSRPEVRENFSFLALSSSGVTVPTLHSVVYPATQLTHLSITEAVSKPFPLQSPPALTSSSLKTLHYEITSEETSTQGTHRPTDGYYSYLSSSLHANALPALRKLYVCDVSFPDSLLLAAPAPSFAPGAVSKSRSGAQGFQQTLEVYTKGPDSLEWMFATMTTEDSQPQSAYGSRHKRGASSASIGRPVSAYDASRGLGPQWGGEARKSIMIGNGMGGFLAVPPSPDELPGEAGLKPASSSSAAAAAAAAPRQPLAHLEPPRITVTSEKENRKSRGDLWR